MRINSATIGMESERTYSATHARVSRLTRFNGRQSIMDGSELFGTQSGNGFADLAQYDSDGNGFIDENDEIFDKLKIWCMDENGQPHLYSLKEKGVGAIGLMHTGTQYSLTNENNETNAVIRNTGFFLFEDGNAGTIQHVDFAKPCVLG